MTTTAPVWGGVQSLLDAYLGLRTDDHVLLLYTSDSAEAAALVTAGVEMRGIPLARVWMAPLRDDGFEERLTDALPPVGGLDGRLVVLTFEKDTMSHTAALAKALASYPRERRLVFRAISSCEGLFATALQVAPDDISARNTALLERFTRAERLHIKTRSGSDLHVRLDQRHRWVSNRGRARSGGTVILPAGEVATYPAEINGVLVADFAFNVNAITGMDARLGEHPVHVKVESGRAVHFECDDPAVMNFLRECFTTQCAVNVGELGFGTNGAIGDAIAMNSHINERRPGVHLGFGQHNQDPGVVGYQCAIHLDLIAAGGLVWTDNDPDPIDLEAVVPSTAPHPTLTRDEDVFSPEYDDIDVDDCCGIITAEGLRPFDCPVT